MPNLRDACLMIKSERDCDKDWREGVASGVTTAEGRGFLGSLPSLGVRGDTGRTRRCVGPPSLSHPLLTTTARGQINFEPILELRRQEVNLEPLRRASLARAGVRPSWS
jgi:hypothetical protein